MGPHSSLARVGAAALATLLFWAPLTRRAHAEDSDKAAVERAAEATRGLARDRVGHRDQLATRGGLSGSKPSTEAEEPEEATPEVEPAGADEPTPSSSEPEPDAPPPEGDTTQVDKDKGSSLPAASRGPATVTSQAIALPKGEGSLQGMGESFTADLSSGTATFSVPVALPKGRMGVQPSLALSYASSGGNGPLGIGWSLAVPFISRQTDKGLPRYVDRASYHLEEDRFMYNGGQELVPVDSAAASAVDGAPVPTELQGWQQYRARVEGAFMRFFRAPDSTRWVVQSKDGTRFDFGRAEAGLAAVEADPAESRRIFRWQLVRMSDAHGASVHYQYVEDGGLSYLDSIYYTEPAACAASKAPAVVRSCSADWSLYAHRVHLVYESRGDVTSSYARTWRVEQAMRLKRIEVTSAGAVAGARTLVRRYHLRYDADSYHSMLIELQVEGRPSRPHPGFDLLVADDSVGESGLGDALVGEALPPMRFGYSKPPAGGVPGFGGVDATVHHSGTSPDISAQDGRAELFDVNADGLPDLLVTDPARYEGGAGVYFNGFAGGVPTRAGEFSRGVRAGIAANLSGTLNFSNLNVVPMDVDGDGRSDVLHMPRRANYGYFVLGKDPTPLSANYSATDGWFFHYVKDLLPAGVTDPRIDLGQDGVAIRTLDVNQDHLIDVVRTTGSSMQTWLNLGQYPGGAGRFGSATAVGNSWTLSTAPIESCLPASGRLLDFSDPSFRLGDMNGDGLQDLVIVSETEIKWWPGRGPGLWGDGARDCASGPVAGREIRMGAAPDLSSELAGVHLMDVNADGADDLLQIGFDAISIWFNRGGTSFTQRFVVRDTPLAIDVLDNVRIVDIDGSTTDDIVFADAGRYRWLDLMGGVKPRVLTRVENGLGALTTLSYASSAEDYLRDLAAAASCEEDNLECFTWQREPVLPGAAQAACDAFVQSKAGTCAHRGFGSPVVSSVVRRITTSDQLDFAGATVSETEYRYHDGYYEGIEQEFRGFGAADTIAYGDANQPTSYSRTHFHQGRRPNNIAADRLADNPNEALKGREFLSEVYDARGVYQHTTHSTYAVRKLLTGQNGVGVSYAYVKSSDAYRYDTALSQQRPLRQVSVAAVLRERASAGLTGVDSAPAAAGDRPHLIQVRHDSYATLRTTIDDVDNVGNLRTQTKWGRGGRGEFGEPVADERVVEQMRSARVPDGACTDSGWLWRSDQSWLEDAAANRYRFTQLAHNECGDVLSTRSSAELPTPGFDFGAGYSQQDGQEIGSARLDPWGQALAQCVGADLATDDVEACLRYSELEYDRDYAALVTAESIAVGRAGGQTNFLTMQATWDRGYGQLRAVADPNGYVSEIAYDGLGRITGMFAPNVEGCEGTSVPKTRISYAVGNPISRITTEQFFSCSDPTAPGSHIVSHSYIDGLGRARANLEQGESDGAAWQDGSPHAWVRGGQQLLNKHGQPYRQYRPSFYEGSAEDYHSVLAPPATPSTSVVHDAFGRPTIETNEDGSYRTRSYHALSSDLCDEGDNGFAESCGIDFRGTCMSERADGHGRVIDQQKRQLTLDGAREHHRLFSYYRADGVVTRMVRARTGDNVLRPESGYTSLDRYVERTFYYDTLGRRIASEDPDTDDHAQSALALRSWRYLYNAAGDLAAVRDPRGCGEDFYYDLAGRLLGERFVGCAEAQLGELPSSDVPTGSVALGVIDTSAMVHTRYYFDAYPDWSTGLLPAHAAGVLGRSTATEDRAQRTVFAYNPRGSSIWSAKQLAVIPDAAPLSSAAFADGRPAFDQASDSVTAQSVSYDAAHTYEVSVRYDHGGRVLQNRLPDDPDFQGGPAPRIEGRMSYHANGAPRRAEVGIDASANSNAGWHAVVDSIAYTHDGLPAVTRYGDGAFSGRPGTVSTTLYDVRRRPVEMLTTRAPAAAATGLGAVSTVFHQRLGWDAVNNLVQVEDRRLPEEWPAGHKPATQFICHDALYRVGQVDYEYQGTANGEDSATDWRDTEALHRDADPMQPEAASMAVDKAELPRRVMTLSYATDWLMNMTSWDDDARAFYERSIGRITNGVDVEGGNLRPSALYLATQLDGNVPGLSGWLETNYGRGGNLLALTVHAQCANAGIGECRDSTRDADELRGACGCAVEQHYVYRWDEQNRLHEARRYDRPGQGAWQLAARQRYRYDAANQRTVKQTLDVQNGTHRAALSVFPGDFERRGLTAEGTEWSAIDGETETQYLVAGARVVWKNRARASSLIDPAQRITFAVTNLIGSTSAVIDLASGELLEAGGFYPNGAREAQLSADSDVPLEPAGFTTKEGDEEVGLTYFGERYLVSRIGRWSTPDPLHIHSGGGGEALNAYHYISGNLLQGRDPLGLEDPKGTQHFTLEDGGKSHNMASTPEGSPEPNNLDGLQIQFPGTGRDIWGCNGKCTWDAPQAPSAAAPGQGGGADGLPNAPGSGNGSGQGGRRDSLAEGLAEGGSRIADNFSAHAGSAAGGFVQGAAKGLAVGIGLGVLGAVSAPVAMVVGGGLLLSGALGTDWSAVSESAGRLWMGQGSASDWRGAGAGVGGVIGGAAGGALGSWGGRLSLGAWGRGRGVGRGCPSCPCFVPGTLVLMADGTTKNIEDVRVGDLVLADDPGDSLPPAASQVTAALQSATERIVRIEIGHQGSVAVIEATGEHPFWTLSMGWVAADRLVSGDRLLTPEGKALVVRSASIEKRSTRTFNLTVRDAHTYYVVSNALGVLVHNQSLPPSTIYKGNGVTIWHNYGSEMALGQKEHPPIHFHVNERGYETRVRPSGQPLTKNDGPLSKNAKEIFRKHRTEFGKLEHRIGKWYSSRCP